MSYLSKYWCGQCRGGIASGGGANVRWGGCRGHV